MQVTEGADGGDGVRAGTEAPRLVTVREPGRPPRHAVVAGPLTVGRNCDGLLLDDPAVSRRHLRLAPADDGGVLVVDQGSAHGTTLNGRPLTAPAVAHAGDVLGLGDSTITVEG